MKKIAIDIRSICGNRAGKGQYTFYLVKSLLSLDKKNSYTLYSSEEIDNFDCFDNVKIKVISQKHVFWHMAIANDCKKNKIDVFWSPSSYLTSFFINKTTKIFTTVHDLVSFFHPNKHNKKAYFIEKFFLKFAIKKSTKIFTVSEYTKNDLLKLYPKIADKIEVIYCAANPNYKNKKILQSKSNFFLSVGTIQPRKNYLNLIKAFKKLVDQHPNIKLFIVGKNGWNYEEVYREIEINNLKDKVEIFGYLNDLELANLYASAIALIFPSFYEGFGMPPIEAMHCSCPVIASDRSCIPEIISDAALFVNPEKPKEISDFMLKLLLDKDLRFDLIKKGHDRCKYFDWSKSAAKLLSIIDKI